MKITTLSANESKAMAALAIFGFLVPNGVFCFYFLTDPEVTRVALSNPIALVFISEAFFLMFLFAWLLKRLGVKKPSGLAFIIMSLLGSMVFSIPATLYLLFKDKSPIKATDR